jgi:hypothetical protein
VEKEEKEGKRGNAKMRGWKKVRREGMGLREYCGGSGL